MLSSIQKLKDLYMSQKLPVLNIGKSSGASILGSRSLPQKESDNAVEVTAALSKDFGMQPKYCAKTH
jgi:hypothetical protein